MAELIPLSFGTGGESGPVTTDSITDASTEGKAVLTGDATAGRNALEAAAASDVTTLEGRVTDAEADIAAIPAPPTVDTLDGLTTIGKALGKAATKTAARTEIEAVHASEVVGLTGAQTVEGVKTFSSPPVVPTPTADSHAVNKAHLDAALTDIPALADVPLKDTTTIAVQWDSVAEWGTYDTDTDRVREFFSQHDAGATPPTAYSPRDIWYGANV